MESTPRIPAASEPRPPDRRSAGLAHHELCFGCGVANLFGLHMEAQGEADGSVTGRFFVKQDHQGSPGVAHGGVLGAALEEAMALALHAEGFLASPARLEVELHAAVPVGAFVRVEAAIERREEGRVWLRATAREDGEGRQPLATASATFESADP